MLRPPHFENNFPKRVSLSFLFTVLYFLNLLLLSFSFRPIDVMGRNSFWPLACHIDHAVVFDSHNFHQGIATYLFHGTKIPLCTNVVLPLGKWTVTDSRCSDERLLSQVEGLVPRRASGCEV